MAKLKKGSAAAKAFMAKLRAARGKTKVVKAKAKKLVKTKKAMPAKKIGSFETIYNAAPASVKKIINDLGEGGDYNKMAKAVIALRKKGYFMDYDLAGQIVKFRKLPAKKVGVLKKVMPIKKASSMHKDTKSHNVNIRVVSGMPIFEYKVSRGGKYYVTSNIPMRATGITKTGDGSDHKRGLSTYLFTELALKKMQKFLGKENTTYIESDF